MEAVALADMAGIAVIDAGKGIAPEHHDRIFSKFERLDGNIGSGSGLGLYISRRLARAMGGDILLDSQPGQGARFTLLLKACDAPIGSAT
jgi:signal transduction histidine kinase